VESDDAGSGSVVSVVSVSTPRGGPRDIPDTIGGNYPLSICGTFSPVGSMSMDVIDEEEGE